MPGRRLASTLGAAVLMAGLLGPLAAAPVAAVTPGTPGPIVFAGYVPGGDQMLFTAMPGGEPVVIPGTVGARAGRWSPDGRVIAYTIWAEGIFLVNPDGSGKVRLFTPAAGEVFGEPVWSPDGARIAYLAFTPGDSDFHLEIVDSAGGTREVVPSGLAVVWDWLADGTFLGMAWRYDLPESYMRNEEIAIMAPDGTVTYLTNTTAYEGVPRLSPDGRQISFLSFGWAPGQVGVYSLGVMNRDGSGMRLWELGSQVTWPAWSPSGTEILVGPAPTAIRADFSGSRRLVGGCCGDGLDWAALAGATTDPIPLVGVRLAAGPDPSAKTSTAVSSTTIWPARDGYRDTIRITERMREPAKATLDIYGPSGARVRRVYFHFDTGTVTYTWNGRSSTGAILPAGRYRLVTTSRDLAGNVRHVTVYVRLYRGYR